MHNYLHLILCLFKTSFFNLFFIFILFLGTTCKIEFNQSSLLALFCAKFACILAISNPVFRWELCMGNV